MKLLKTYKRSSGLPLPVLMRVTRGRESRVSG